MQSARQDDDSSSSRSVVKRLRSLVGTLAAATAAVVLGVSGAGVTHAYLNATAGPAASTITAGTAAIQINGSATATLSPTALSPAAPAVWAFTVTNAGDAPMSLAAAISAPGGPAYAASAKALLTAVPNAAACTAAVAGTPSVLNGYSAPALGALPVGASQWYCLVVSLPNPMPAAGSGSSHSFTMTVNATQTPS